MNRSTQQCEETRQGAAVVEGTLVLAVFLVIIMGMLDLGLALLKYNTLSEASLVLAREASVHGKRADPQSSVWGPATYTGTADDGSEMAESVRPILVLIRPEDVSLQIEWTAGDNKPGQFLKTQVEASHQPVIPFLFGNEPFRLTAECRTLVAH